MPEQSRTPASCPEREPTDSGEANCRLISRLLPADDTQALVSVEACEACCRSFPPTEDDFNPVVAGLAFSIADKFLETESAPAAKDQLLRLRDRAESSIPVLLPDEDDSEPIVRNDSLTPLDISVDQIAAVLPTPTTSNPDSVRWAVGVTTAPRRQPALDLTLESMSLAGWAAPTLYVDGDVELPDRSKECRNVQWNSVGALRSYYQTLDHLLNNNPDANALMIVQDDTLFPTTAYLREYVEQLLWPGDSDSIVSLYCPSDYSLKSNGWAAFEETWHFGALAFVFPRGVVEAFLRDEEVRSLSLVDERRGGIDVVVGEWAKRAGIPIYRSTPSVVQHIGHVSALWATSRAVGLRRATHFLGEHLH